MHNILQILTVVIRLYLSFKLLLPEYFDHSNEEVNQRFGTKKLDHCCDKSDHEVLRYL